MIQEIIIHKFICDMGDCTFESTDIAIREEIYEIGVALDCAHPDDKRAAQRWTICRYCGDKLIQNLSTKGKMRYVQRGV